MEKMVAWDFYLVSGIEDPKSSGLKQSGIFLIIDGIILSQNPDHLTRLKRTAENAAENVERSAILKTEKSVRQ